MALASPSGLASFQQTAGQFLDLSDILAELIRSDNTAFISRLSMGSRATETIHSWTEDALNPITVTAASTLASNSASLTLFTNGGSVPAPVVIGALLRDNAISANALNEVLQVTGTSGGSLTITRAYGNTTGTAHAAGAVYTVFAVPAQENQDSPSDISLARSKFSNFTQIFLKGIQVGYTAQKVRQAGVPDEFGHQVSYRMKEIMRELDASSLLSVANATTGSGSTSQYRSMAGLMQFAVGGSIGAIQVLTTGATFTTNETIAPDIANTMGSAIWYNGGMTAGAYNGFIVMGGKQKRRFAGFDQAYRRLDYSDNRVGFTVEKFLSDLGYEFEIIVDPWMPDDVIVMGDLGRLALVPLDMDEMRVEDIAKTGRSLKAMVTGQYTIEVKNAPQTTAIHVNLA